jgi:hypothetical protein
LSSQLFPTGPPGTHAEAQEAMIRIYGSITEALAVAQRA